MRPCSSVGRVTVDLIRRSWVRFPPWSKDFFFASRGSLFPFSRANAQWVIHGLSSTIIYTSELILCSTIHMIIRHFHMSHNSFRVRGASCKRAGNLFTPVYRRICLWWNFFCPNGQKRPLLRPLLFKQNKWQRNIKSYQILKNKTVTQKWLQRISRKGF